MKNNINFLSLIFCLSILSANILANLNYDIATTVNSLFKSGPIPFAPAQQILGSSFTRGYRNSNDIHWLYGQIVAKIPDTQTKELFTNSFCNQAFAPGNLNPLELTTANLDALFNWFCSLTFIGQASNSNFMAYLTNEYNKSVIYNGINSTIQAIFHGGFAQFEPAQTAFGKLSTNPKYSSEITKNADGKFNLNPPPTNEPDHSNNIISLFNSVYSESNDFHQQNLLIQAFCIEATKVGNIHFDQLNATNASLLLKYCPNFLIPGITDTKPDPECDVSKLMDLPVDFSTMNDFNDQFRKKSNDVQKHIIDLVGDPGDPNAKPPRAAKPDGDLQKFINLIGQLSFQDKTMLDAYAKLPKDQTDPTSVNYQAYSDWYQNQLIDSDTPPAIKDQDTAMEKYLKRQVMLSLCDPTQTDCNQSALDYFKAQNDIQDIQAKIMTLLNKYNSAFSPAPIRKEVAATNTDGSPFSYKNQQFKINTVDNWDPNIISDEKQTQFVKFITNKVNACTDNLKKVSIRLQQQIFDLTNKIRNGQIPLAQPDALTVYTTTASIASTNLAFNVALMAAPPPLMIGVMVASVIPGPDDLLNNVMNVFGTAIANEIVEDINLSKEAINDIKSCKQNAKTCTKGFLKMGEVYARLIFASIGGTVIYQIVKDCVTKEFKSDDCSRSIKNALENTGLKFACCLTAKTSGVVCKDADGNPITDCGLGEEIFNAFKNDAMNQISDFEDSVNSIKKDKSAKNISINMLKMSYTALKLSTIVVRVGYKLGYNMITGLCTAIAGMAGSGIDCSGKLTEYMNLVEKGVINFATSKVYNDGLKKGWQGFKNTVANAQFWNNVGNNMANNIKEFFTPTNLSNISKSILDKTNLSSTFNILTNIGGQAVAEAQNISNIIAKSQPVTSAVSQVESIGQDIASIF